MPTAIVVWSSEAPFPVEQEESLLEGHEESLRLISTLTVSTGCSAFSSDVMISIINVCFSILFPVDFMLLLRCAFWDIKICGRNNEGSADPVSRSESKIQSEKQV